MSLFNTFSSVIWSNIVGLLRVGLGLVYRSVWVVAATLENLGYPLFPQMLKQDRWIWVF